VIIFKGGHLSNNFLLSYARQRNGFPATLPIKNYAAKRETSTYKIIYSSAVKFLIMEKTGHS